MVDEYELAATVRRWYALHGHIFGALGDATMHVAAAAASAVADARATGAETPDGLSALTNAADHLDEVTARFQAIPSNPSRVINMNYRAAATENHRAAEALRVGASTIKSAHEFSPQYDDVLAALSRGQAYMDAASMERRRLLGE